MREILEQHYNVIKTVAKELEASKAKLERNAEAFGGNVPEKYQKAFNKLKDHIDSLEKQLKSAYDIVGTLEKYYIFSETTANLYFEKDTDIQPFLDKASELRDNNDLELSKAIKDMDLDRLDGILSMMRKEFIEEMFDAYTKYAKTISFNKQPA